LARDGQPFDFRRRTPVVKVIASEVRKGNVLDVDGQLCTVMKAESIRPGKGTPTTHIDMRRISDGVKIVQSYRTTESVERVFLDEKNYNYLYEDDMGFNFMEPETFEQISINKDLIGDQAQWLQENMQCSVMLFEGNPVSIELPAKVIRRGRAGGEGADGVVVLQAREAVERRARDGAAAHRGRHACHRHDGGRQLRRAGEGLIAERRGLSADPNPRAGRRGPDARRV
jgi:translation elongation factor P